MLLNFFSQGFRQDYGGLLSKEKLYTFCEIDWLSLNMMAIYQIFRPSYFKVSLGKGLREPSALWSVPLYWSIVETCSNLIT